uniref:SH2 domain-containing protein n=1 Tax=Steinernema glaseri TaxID=37863 RepID=A0A1I7YJH7_9BILA
MCLTSIGIPNKKNGFWVYEKRSDPENPLQRALAQEGSDHHVLIRPAEGGGFCTLNMARFSSVPLQEFA